MPLLLPDDLLERGLLYAGTASLGRCCCACHAWRSVAEKDACWQLALGSCARPPYTTMVTRRGAQVWVARELGGSVAYGRDHLRRLQETRELRHLFKFLHNFHNGVELEPLTARRRQAWYNSEGVIATATVEMLNFWPHESWILLRAAPPAEATELDDMAHHGAEVPGLDEVDLSGSEVRLRCWEATCPSGRLGPNLCYLLDCGPRGDLFRVPPLSCLELGGHLLCGRMGASHRLRIECLAGRWPQEHELLGPGLPLPACSADAFVFSTAVDGALLPDEGELSALAGVSEEWYEGKTLIEGYPPLGPVLYQTAKELDLSEWL